MILLVYEIVSMVFLGLNEICFVCFLCFFSVSRFVVFFMLISLIVSLLLVIVYYLLFGERVIL